ncbi:MAG: conjugal transfer protein TraN [Rickettsiaceae bacterium]|nr:conjugal transfer protein TraN [Rickettsiaceae bacterium]
MHSQEMKSCYYIYLHLPLRLLLIIIVSSIAINNPSFAAFSPGFPCANSQKICSIGAGYKIIDGVKLYKDCWEYSYVKTCEVASKDDCKNFAHCYEIAQTECFQKDRYGNCVNQGKDFSCEDQISYSHLQTEIKQISKGEKAKEFVCKGIPCIDGNCIDKSYDMDSNLMSSISELYAVSRLSGIDDLDFQIFKGSSLHCSKKPASYLNCCKQKGWGEDMLGAKCTSSEQNLQNLRSQNKCIYAGNKKSGKEPFHVSKHYFCCFSNLFTKVFQAQARQQLGIGFGSPGAPDCRGLTLSEIRRLDFEKMDFSEFISEIHYKMKIPSTSDLKMRAKSSLDSINHTNPKGDGLNPNIERSIEREQQR